MNYYILLFLYIVAYQILELQIQYITRVALARVKNIDTSHFKENDYSNNNKCFYTHQNRTNSKIIL